MSYLEGRDNDVLWLMFKAAKTTTEFANANGDHIVCSRYDDGKNPVYFKENIGNHIVQVDQPGTCLFTKFFKTNTFKTKWERI